MPLAETWVNFGGIVPVDYHPVNNPVGAGPYKLKSFTPGQRSLFTRFENYYKDGKPYADELEIIDFKDQVSRLAALRSGQIDMANVMPTEQLEVLQRDPRLRVLKSVTGNWLSFDMNLDKPPFNDPRVREAFRLLADREELVRRALNGQGRVANDLYAPSDPTCGATAQGSRA
jgi:peptide/nickel transport system substrate-binding protein